MTTSSTQSASFKWLQQTWQVFLFQSKCPIIIQSNSHSPNSCLQDVQAYDRTQSTGFGYWVRYISAADGPIGLKFGLWRVLPIILVPEVNKNPARSAATTQNLHSGYSKWYISAADGPIGLKFGLWLVLPIILVPEVNKNPARSAATTPNVESTLTLTLLKRPQMEF